MQSLPREFGKEQRGAQGLNPQVWGTGEANYITKVGTQEAKHTQTKTQIFTVK